MLLRRLSISLLSLLLIFISFDGKAQQRGRARTQTRTQTSIPTTARLLPADAVMFSEVESLAAIADDLEKAGGLRTLSGPPAKLITLAFIGDLQRFLAGAPIDQAALARTRFGIALLGDLSRETRLSNVLIADAQSSAAAVEMEKALTGFWSKNVAALGDPRVEVRGAATISSYNGDSVRSARFGSVVAIGDSSGVDQVLALQGKTGAATLAKAADFNTARARLNAPRSVFTFINGPKVTPLIDRALRNAKGQYASILQSAIQFVGFQALKGLAISSAFERGGVTERSLVLINRNAGTLLNILLSPQPLNLKAAGYVPQSAAGYFSLSVDTMRLWDSLLKTFGPLIALQLGMLSPEAAVVHYEKQLGFKFKEGLLASLGGEMVLIVGPLEVKQTAAQPTPPAPSRSYYGLISVKNPEMLKNALNRLRAYFNKGEQANEQAGGDIIEIRGALMAIVGDFLVIGAKNNIEAVIEAHRSGQSVASSAGFKQSLQGQNAQLVAQSYFDRSVAAGMLASTGAQTGVNGAISSANSLDVPAGLALQVRPDELGLLGESLSPVGLVGMIILSSAPDQLIGK